MAIRSVLTFACPSCGKTLQVPETVLSPEGVRGKCRGCGTGLALFLDGSVQLVGPAIPPSAQPPQPAPTHPELAAPPSPPPPPVTEAPDPKQERTWHLRFLEPKVLLGPGPYTLEELGEFILHEEVAEGDLGRVGMGTWLPLSSYPALEPYWTERNINHRESHGDAKHCSVHRDREPGWLCPKCKSYLCENCVIDRPLIEGGAPRMLCDACEFEALVLPKKGGLLPGLFGKRR